MIKLDKIIYLKLNKYVVWLMIINNLDLGMWLSYFYLVNYDRRIFIVWL